MKKKHIVIIGLGGVGGYFGFKINKYNEESHDFKVTFIARKQTFDVINERGLILRSSEFAEIATRPNAVLENISEISEPDLVLICVKEYDLENVSRQLKEVITKDTILLPLMNGVDIYDRIRKIIPQHAILPSCIYISAHIKERGVIEHRSMPGKIILGKDIARPEVHVDWIVDLLQKSKINFDLQDSPYKAIWTKFLFIASFGLVTAKYNSSFGIVCNDPIQKQEATAIMNEIKGIAQVKGITLDADAVEDTFKIARSFPFETSSSIQLDIYRKKDFCELDLLGGTIIRYGRELNVETPCTNKIFNELQQIIRNKQN